MVAIDPQQLGLEFGSGAFIGAIIGFAAKKIAKILAIIVGLELALFKFLEAKGILSVDWNRLSAGLLKTGEQVQDPGWIAPILSTMSIGVGFTGGFLVGFKKG
ncbi:FUN14 domain-containing protein [Halostella salina]|uniref:FUN14 domain-containing protein n=1 Tax=Halostella salina TaxID=1547897 RepID=UPI000EF75B83|nr:FUN14 domain-containing protein [Halostella salina]